jgi:predicted O-methyltransferase YrrM
VNLFPLLQYLEYYLKKVDGHSLQSPFVYHLYQGLKSHYSHYKNKFPYIEERREALLKDKKEVLVNDLGAGSHRFSSRKRKIADIVRYSSSSQKFNLLYQFFCSLTPAEDVVELGTCLGLNALYLAEVTKKKLYTFEGADILINSINNSLDSNEKIEVIGGDISSTLPAFLNNSPKVDFAFLDANHTYEHTSSYYGQLTNHVHQDSIIVIGDIHWSKEMQKAWKEIIQTDMVRLSLDFYECGVLFYKKGIQKAHYVLTY